MLRYLPLLLLAGLLLGAAPAGGEDDPAVQRARALFKQAEVHFSLGEFQHALKLYKEAYRTKQLPEFLFNIGQCERHLGNCRDAVFHFRQFLLHQPDAPEKKQVNELILECEAKLAAEEVSATSQPTSPNTAVDHNHPISRTWFWVGVGTTGVLLTTSLVTGLLAAEKDEQAGDPGVDRDRRRELQDQSDTLELTAWTTLGLGLAAAGGTVALYFFSEPAAPPKVLSVAPRRGGGLVLLRTEF